MKINEDNRLCNLIAKCLAYGRKVGIVSDDDNMACLDLLMRKDTSWSPSEDFLDTLESEKPMQEGLAEELDKFIASGKSVTVEDCGTYKVSYHDFKKVARHFAEWGYLRAAEKYNEIEYNRQRAEEEMPLPEDTVLFNKGVAEGRRLAEEEQAELLTIAHLQGADQMKKQMMEEAVEGLMAYEPHLRKVIIDLHDIPNGTWNGSGTLVDVIIIKKEDEK